MTTEKIILTAERIVTAIEGCFRDWLMANEHAEAVALVARVLADASPEEGKSRTELKRRACEARITAERERAATPLSVNPEPQSVNPEPQSVNPVPVSGNPRAGIQEVAEELRQKCNRTKEERASLMEYSRSHYTSSPDIARIAVDMRKAAYGAFCSSGGDRTIEIEAEKRLAAILAREWRNLTAAKDAEIARLLDLYDRKMQEHQITGEQALEWKARAERAEHAADKKRFADSCRAELVELREERDKLRAQLETAEQQITALNERAVMAEDQLAAVQEDSKRLRLALTEARRIMAIPANAAVETWPTDDEFNQAIQQADDALAATRPHSRPLA